MVDGTPPKYSIATTGARVRGRFRVGCVARPHRGRWHQRGRASGIRYAKPHSDSSVLPPHNIAQLHRQKDFGVDLWSLGTTGALNIFGTGGRAEPHQSWAPVQP